VAKFGEVFLTTGQVLLSLFLIGLGLWAIYSIAAGHSPHSYLFAAYIATWLIHAFYLGTLVRRFSRLRQELRELSKR
jgi:CcmD family protein